MDVVTAARTDTTTTASQNSSANEVSSDFKTFLQMLTVQMQNQDPLNPVESTDYAVQLATFSSVEQQVKTNDLLEALADQFSANGLSEISNWVGMEARAAADAKFDGTAVKLHVSPEDGATSSTLVVTDSAGVEVFRGAIDPAGGDIEWDGNTTEGQTAAVGIYSFSVEHNDNSGLLSNRKAEVYADVTEVKIDNGDLVVVMAGGIEVAASDVTGVRDAGQP